MSLRRVSEEAGLDEPLENTTLSAFGTRQFIGSEGRFKELKGVNHGMDRREEPMKGKVEP